MRRKGPKMASLFLLPLMLLTLFLAAPQSASASSLAFSWAGVTCETKSDGSARYTIDLGLPPLPNPGTLGGLTVTATGPGGFSHTFTDDELYLWMGEAELWQAFPDLSPGLYTFTVSDGEGHSATRTDLLANPHSMPLVDSTTIQSVRRGDGSYRFSWAPVGSDKPYYYRLVISDVDGNDVYSGDRTFDSSQDIPSGTVADGAVYSARVEVHDAPSFDLLNNRSNSSYVLFTPAASDYSANRIPFDYAYLAYRTASTGTRTVDLTFSLGSLAGITSAVVTGPNGFSYSFDMSKDKLASSAQFFKSLATAATGSYLFDVVVNDQHNYAYATLPAPTALPAFDDGTLQARDLGNGFVRFSWADVDATGALYYRVLVWDGTSGATLTGPPISEPRINQTFVDIPQAQLSALNNKSWRVEVFDSSSGIAVRNKSVSSLVPLAVQPFDPAAPVLDGCTISHVTNFNGSDLSYIWGGAHAPAASLTQLRIDGPNGYTRDLFAKNDFLEQGSPAAGLYRCTATDSNGKTVTRYNYQPAAHAIDPVDFRTVSVATLPGGDLSLSWAPVASDVPLWYGVDFLQPVVVNGSIEYDTISLPVQPPYYYLSQTSLTVPAAQLPAGPLLIRIYALDGGNFTTYNNYSRSVTFAFQGGGFNYASLGDSDGDGYASNVPATVLVQTVGTGSGTVNSSPTGIACASGSTSGCSATFPDGMIQLTATPAADSTFGGWQGDCVNNSGACILTRSGPAAVSALFTKAPMVMLYGSNSLPFALLQSAYRSAATGDWIQSRAGTVAENLVFDRAVAVTIKGGYDASFSKATGTTAIAGSLVIRNGTVHATNLAVHKTTP